MKKQDLKVIYQVLTIVEKIDTNFMMDWNNPNRADKHFEYVKEIKDILQPIINSHKPL